MTPTPTATIHNLCIEGDLTTTLSDMASASKAQRDHNTKFRVLVAKDKKTCLRKYLTKNNRYYKQLLNLIKEIDVTPLSCTFCELSTQNVTTLAQYETLVRSLYKLSDDLKSCYPQRRNVPCTRSREACSKPFNYNLQKALKRYARKLRDQNLKKTQGVPKEACKE